MFLEPNFKGQRNGWIEVVCGCMFSGKTEELIRRLKRAKIAAQKVEVFKPHVDTRYDETAVVSHDTNSLLAQPVDHSSKILTISAETTVVGVDEAQFFDADLVENCQQLALGGVRVIVAGWTWTIAANLSARCRGCWLWPNTSRKSTRFVCIAAIWRRTLTVWRMATK